MESLFKALNDPARRTLLDSLRRNDGQTLSQFQEQLEMSRFGVMKHLGVLEEAGLITTRKVGRFKHHYLNVLPLQEVVDRWIEPFLAAPLARGVLDMKARLERTDMETPDLVMATYIDCTHEALWEAMTKGEMLARYHFATPHIEGDYETGGAVAFKTADGTTMLRQEVTKVEPMRLIETTFEVPNGKPPSRCRYLVEPTEQGMKLTIEHYELGENAVTREGWTLYLASIKTFLETGKSRPFPKEMH